MNRSALSMHQPDEFLHIEIQAIVHAIDRNVYSYLQLVKPDQKVKRLKCGVFEDIHKLRDFLLLFNEKFFGVLGTVTSSEFIKNKNVFQMLNYAYAPAILGYRVGQKYDGFVSYIGSPDGGYSVVFIIDTQFPLKLNLWEHVIEVYDHVPMPGVVFGVDLGPDGIFRAVRDNVLSRTPQTASVMFIDSGETTNMSSLLERKLTTFKLSKEAQSLPAYAIPCKVVKILDADGIEIAFSKKSLPTFLYQTIEFHVTDIDRPLADMLTIHLHKKPSPAMAPLSTLNPFAKEFTIATRMKALSVSECTKFEASLDQSNNRETTLEDAYSAMPYNGQNSESESNINHHQTSDSAGLGDQPSNESARNTVFVLSAREREELYEEPANTSNVMKAVLGYDPMDEKRICRHFNPNTGRCFKGNNCRLKHVAIMKDGWTRDKVESVAKTFAVRKVPEPDEIVPILPMYIENLKTFYAYVLCACECPAKLTPKELKTQMNAEENRRQFRPISRAPVPGELIIVDLDGQFYRGRVTDVTDDGKHDVFFLDYGFSIHIEATHMYKWSARWDYAPFLAWRCHLVGIQTGSSSDEAAIEKLTERILHKITGAIIVSSNPEELHVRLTDENGHDIVQVLCGANFARNDGGTPECAGGIPA